jgi:hypothetical protein
MKFVYKFFYVHIYFTFFFFHVLVGAMETDEKDVSMEWLADYFEQLKIYDADPEIMEIDVTIVPPSGDDSGDEAIEVLRKAEPEEEPEDELVIRKRGPAQGKREDFTNATSFRLLDPSTLENYPKKRSWTQKISLFDFPSFHEPLSPELDGLDPVALFELFFDKPVFDYFVEQTVAYAHANKRPLFMVSAEEMKVFIGIHLLSGYIDVPRWRMYWECGTESYNQLVASAMRRDRFEEIKAHFHVSDNSKLDKGGFVYCSFIHEFAI